MAYYRKLASGRWRAEIEVKGERETEAGFATKAEAMAWATKRESELRAGQVGKFPDKTLAEALERYEREVSAGKASKRYEALSFERTRREFPALCAKTFHKITPEDLDQWQRERLKKVKPATVMREANILRNVWTVGAKVWRWTSLESPWKMIELPGKQPARDRRVYWHEARRILRALGYTTGKPPHNLQSQIAYAWLIALRTAMRSGEILGLTADKVNLQTRVIRLDTHKTFHHTRRPRFVPFTHQAARLLRIVCKSGPLFTVTGPSKDAMFRKTVKRLGIDDMTFHDSRAEALLQLSKRVDVLTLQKISGHADINQLAAAYYRPTPEQVAASL